MVQLQDSLPLVLITTCSINRVFAYEGYPRTVDYSAIVLWVLKTTYLIAEAIAAKSTAIAGICVRAAASSRGVVALGATVAAAGLTVAAVGAAVAGGVAAEKGGGKDAPTAKL
ncbi:snf1-related protein kinase regulatory subunit gamma-1-like protein [Artemisia annua]|uniref:Snf1-related protein kinase regulatory subunit gamma-1-like protein n=1 Tax=Artemisia annua TaxID=35608 RepID=A0A2U1KG10_ARTAN|nr:snf1-related protein kinase regulatory subunit gamma-1-like protein [Artemisia annua]